MKENKKTPIASPNPGKLTAAFINSGGESVSIEEIEKEVRKKHFFDKVRSYSIGKKRFFLPILILGLFIIHMINNDSQDFSS